MDKLPSSRARGTRLGANKLQDVRDRSNIPFYGSAGDTNINRLMSDYEVTLVNDNSKTISP